MISCVANFVTRLHFPDLAVDLNCHKWLAGDKSSDFSGLWENVGVVTKTKWCESMHPVHVLNQQRGAAMSPLKVSKHSGSQSLCSSTAVPEMEQNYTTLGLQNESCMCKLAPKNTVFLLNLILNKTFSCRMWLYLKSWGYCGEPDFLTVKLKVAAAVFALRVGGSFFKSIVWIKFWYKTRIKRKKSLLNHLFI